MRLSTPLLLLMLASVLLAGCEHLMPSASDGPPAGDPHHLAPAQPAAPVVLTQPRQLTFAGRRSGEGYLSRDGARMVFQSERDPENPFYQIFWMDLDDGEVERLSPGVGKTTCAWIHPGGARVLFSSTHLDPEAPAKQKAELDARAEGRERRYAWDYDEHYDLFAVTPGDPEAPLERLTRARGYDAEASWSPNGREIVFASNRHAYDENGLIVDEETFALDPAAFVDLYIMDANGENVRRLTDGVGYDGGPFFSPDGTRIVWRRFSQDGTTAEIHTMRTDGSDVKQLTRLGAMSCAPFYHPSGEYVVFTTNLHGMNDFELYIVDSEGAREPVRMSMSPGFDGLPVFGPSGHELFWTSNRGGGGRSQIFRGRWNDVLARELLDLPAIRTGAVGPLLPLPVQTTPEIHEADLRAHVEALASDVTEGRRAGTAGERIATSYVARAFRAAGLEPAGDRTTYFQEFDFTAGISLGEDNALEIEPAGAAPPQVDLDWRPFAFSRVGTVEPTEVVYAGYGIIAPAGQGQRAIDSYAGLEVKDRWLLVFRYMPEGLSPESRQHLHRYSSLRYKAMLARDRGAQGILVVSGPNSKVKKELAPLQFDVSLGGTSIAALSITDAMAEQLLRGSGRSLRALQDEADHNSAAPGLALEGVRVGAQIDLVQQKRKGRNVLARLQVGDAPSHDFVVVGAHIDHLGRGTGSSSLARPEERGQIHSGADDNASGVAALLEIAQQLIELSRRGELEARRDVVFAAWSGEELGLIGSSHFVNNLVNPHAADEKVSDRVFAYLNMDMVGRLRDVLSLFGVDSSTAWPTEIERRNVPIGLAITAQGDSYLPTDATAFYLKEVPILAAFTGAHSEYHTPRDQPELINFGGLRGIAELMASITRSLSGREEPLDYVATTRPSGSSGAARMRVYLGTIPDYARTDLAGVLLSGVGKDGPADRAGLRSGDVIVELAGRAIENIYDYTYALDALAIDEPATIVVLRDGEQLELSIVPASRD